MDNIIALCTAVLLVLYDYILKMRNMKVEFRFSFVLKIYYWSILNTQNETHSAHFTYFPCLNNIVTKIKINLKKVKIYLLTSCNTEERIAQNI